MAEEDAIEAEAAEEVVVSLVEVFLLNRRFLSPLGGASAPVFEF